MSALVNVFFQLPVVKGLRAFNSDDEHVDRLNHRVTVGLILASVMITSTTSFVFSRISCWVPAQLRHGSYHKYIENYCWISNTYYIHSNVTPPDSDEDRRKEQIGRTMCTEEIPSTFILTLTGYYQWVPLLLLFMALCFYAPRMFWRSVNIHHGMDIQSLIGRSQVSATRATQMLQHYFHSFESPRTSSLVRHLHVTPRHNKHRGNYLFSMYVLTRVMYLCNSIVQLILLNALLGHRGTAWFLDFDIIRSILRNGSPLLDSPYFPRVTLCDVKIRELGEIHRYTVQCALPINILNEKIFLGLSFWFSYVILHNICSFVQLVIQQLERQRIDYIRRLTTLLDDERGEDTIEQFTRHYLSSDGVFLLRLISHNASELQAMQIAGHLFRHFSSSTAL